MIINHGKLKCHYGIRIFCSPRNVGTACLFCDGLINNQVTIEVWAMVHADPKIRIGHICEECLKRSNEENILALKEHAIEVRRQARRLEDLAIQFDGISEEILNQARREFYNRVVEVYEDDEDQIYDWFDGNEVCWQYIESGIMSCTVDKCDDGVECDDDVPF